MRERAVIAKEGHFAHGTDCQDGEATPADESIHQVFRDQLRKKPKKSKQYVAQKGFLHQNINKAALLKQIPFALPAF